MSSWGPAPQDIPMVQRVPPPATSSRDAYCQEAGHRPVPGLCQSPRPHPFLSGFLRRMQAQENSSV